MIPDTGTNVTVIGTCHLKLLLITKTSLQPLSAITTLTSDGSQIFLALGWFQATLKLGNKSCIVKIHVHKGIQIPFISFSDCQDLAINLPDFPKPVLAITHINRCAEQPLLATISPYAAQDFFLLSHHLPSSSPPGMPYMSTGKWNSPRRTGTSPLSSLYAAGSSTAEDPWALQPPVTPSVSEVTWLRRIEPIVSGSRRTSSCSTRSLLHICRGFTRC
ncbi:hypothetical protein SK128_001561 [Halocaridina rubra]|uniref:Peptidase A2 domain-containing protein n=1 Tax=Halocaridina rubra TaxID=373956 RepID=A0AAN8XAZ0_HALRR